jgi:hypothetical protein
LLRREQVLAGQACSRACQAILHTLFNTPISLMFEELTPSPSRLLAFFDTSSSAGLLSQKDDDRFHSFGLLTFVRP